MNPFEVPRQVLPFVLNQRGLVGIGAEIGVCRGIFSEWILTHWQGKLLYLVDPWTALPDYEEKHTFEEDLAQTLERMQAFPGRYEIVRKTSLEAARDVEDGTLDFCYIDANHVYKNVLEDLEAWYPKVRPGGLFAGDDYGCFDETPVSLGHGGYLCGVKKAVDEFALKVGRNVSIDWLAQWECSGRFVEANGTEHPFEVTARNYWWIK